MEVTHVSLPLYSSSRLLKYLPLTLLGRRHMLLEIIHYSVCTLTHLGVAFANFHGVGTPTVANFKLPV